MSLPDELVREILSKLRSSKSAVRLRCVCKSWCDLTTRDPGFGDELVNHTDNCSIENEDPFMVFHAEDQVHNLFQIRTHSSYTFGRVGFPDASYIRLLGSCNGLVCFLERSYGNRIDNQVSLYNPITREYRKLPPHAMPYDVYLGFGLDTCRNDYKVINIVENSRVDIYKLSTDCWSRLDVEPESDYIRGFLSSDSVYLNGCCHWVIVSLEQKYYVRKIVTFDFQTETFDLVDFPRIENPGYTQLGVLDNSVAVCLINEMEKRTEVYVMSKYGNTDSWIKKFSFGMEEIHVAKVGPCWVHGTNLLELKSTGELITSRTAEEEGEQGQKARVFKVDCPSRDHRMLVFKPSLVSLRSGCYMSALKHNRFTSGSPL